MAAARVDFEPGFPARCSIRCTAQSPIPLATCASSPSCAATVSRSDHASTDWPEHLVIAREAILDTLAAHGALVLRGALRKKQPEQTDAERLEQVLRLADALYRRCSVCVCTRL